MGKVTHQYNLTVIYPALAAQWHPTNNATLSPHNVTPSSSKRRWWLCQKGHQWQDTVSNRVHFRTDCPYCSGQGVCAEIPFHQCIIR